jgi:16S rRNA (cytidine1402-2'-O)-methyltransferase
MVPTPLVAMEDLTALSSDVLSQIRTLRYFIAEVPKTARQFLKAIDLPCAIQDVKVWGLEKHGKTDLSEVWQALESGSSVGLLSEAGCPGVADPGSFVVAEAHRRNIPVKPLVGPSSILLALMASGMNGQSFTFAGYLPRERDALIRALNHHEKDSAQYNRTQIFIEAPYRNDKLFNAMCQCLRPETRLCIARDLTSPEQYIKTQTIGEWKQCKDLELFKRPAIFLFAAQHRKRR